MIPTYLARIDLAANIERREIEEQLIQLHFDQAQAELEAHRRLAADLMRALKHLGIITNEEVKNEN